MPRETRVGGAAKSDANAITRGDDGETPFRV
jgi:hypothetical protein